MTRKIPISTFLYNRFEILVSFFLFIDPEGGGIHFVRNVGTCLPLQNLYETSYPCQQWTKLITIVDSM